MTERPILFSGPMVRAILARTKTQTRRLMKPQPTGERRPLAEWSRGVATACHDMAPDEARLAAHSQKLEGRVFPFTTDSGVLMSPICPYGQPGDRLWVRETFMDLLGTGIEASTGNPSRYAYAADTPPGSHGDECRKDYRLKWKPSIFMPRIACRLVLEVAAVRVERLQDINEADAASEGCAAGEIVTHRGMMGPFSAELTKSAATAKEAYRVLWDYINAKTAPWSSNPWVWVVEFRRCVDTTAKP